MVKNMYVEDFENSREFEVKEQLEKERKNIKSFDELVTFLERVKDTCNTGYGTAPRAIAQAALATAWYLSDKFGLTGFQASCTMWDFIEGWTYSNNKCGMRIVDYDNMLYPQYADNFDKAISKDVFLVLQKEAKRNLQERKSAHPAVISHWQSIVDGNVPFGYIVRD